MQIDRSKIEAVYTQIRQIIDSNDWAAFAELFAEDGTFVNSMTKPVRGREALRLSVTNIPTVINRVEWKAIDGKRLVMAWNERRESMPDDRAPYRGISTFVFDDDGRIKSYEGMFDPAALAAAIAP